MKRVKKKEAKRTKSNHTVKTMLNKDQHKIVVNSTKANLAWDFKRQSLRNTLLITVSGDREKSAIERLDECEVGGQTTGLPAIPARMRCDNVLE